MESGKTRLTLLFPNGLLFSPFGARLTLRLLSGRGGNAPEKISPETVSRLFTGIRQFRRTHGSFELLEVESAEGERVRIRL